jgi:putative flippase GtrA
MPAIGYSFWAMGKKRREEKMRRMAAEKGRPRSWREMLRFFPGLFLRTFVVVLGLGIVMALLSTLGLTFFANFWVQAAVYVSGYILLQRWIMGPLHQSRLGQILKQPLKKK